MPQEPRPQPTTLREPSPDLHGPTRESGGRPVRKNKRRERPEQEGEKEVLRDRNRE